jgi:hypothetical protein
VLLSVVLVAVLEVDEVKTYSEFLWSISEIHGTA